MEVEQAEEEAKKVIRLPRSYEQSDKKLKTVKIVTKKSDVAINEKKKPKKAKTMATSSKQSASASAIEEKEDEEELVEENEEEVQEKDIEAAKEEPVITPEEDDDDRAPLAEMQPPQMTVAEKLAAMGKKPGAFSKTAATYEKETSYSRLFLDQFLFSSKSSPKVDKGKSKKVLAPSSINKMDTNRLDYSSTSSSNKEVSIIDKHIESF